MLGIIYFQSENDRLKNLTTIMLITVCLGIWIGIGISQMLTKEDKTKEDKTVSSQVVLTELRKVSKLATHEAYYEVTFVYNEPDGWMLDLYDKKIVVQATAQIVYGFNLEGVEFMLDSTSKVVSITNMPKPELLYTDIELFYLDTETGLFTELQEVDLNEINLMARTKLREKAKENSHLWDTSLEETVTQLTWVARKNGYQLKL